MKVNTYLNFDGNAEEAFNFYKTVFGGDFIANMKMGDAPDADKLSEEEKSRTMHISLPLSNDTILMASDIVPSMGHSLKKAITPTFPYILRARKRQTVCLMVYQKEGKLKCPWPTNFGAITLGVLLTSSVFTGWSTIIHRVSNPINFINRNMHNSFNGQQTTIVEVFRTSVTTIEKAEFLLDKLQKEFPCCEINFDLEDCDNILRVATAENTMDTAPIVKLVKKYQEDIQVLPDEIPIKVKGIDTYPQWNI